MKNRLRGACCNCCRLEPHTGVRVAPEAGHRQEEAAVEPVCGEDRLSYMNSRIAALAGATVKHPGYCRGAQE
jgi:hypothetical protein